MALPRDFFGALSIVNICEQEIPTNDSPVGASLRKSTGLKPAIDTVEAAQSLFDLVWLPSRDLVLPGQEHAG